VSPSRDGAADSSSSFQFLSGFQRGLAVASGLASLGIFQFLSGFQTNQKSGISPIPEFSFNSFPDSSGIGVGIEEMPAIDFQFLSGFQWVFILAGCATAKPTFNSFPDSSMRPLLYTSSMPLLLSIPFRIPD